LGAARDIHSHAVGPTRFTGEHAQGRGTGSAGCGACTPSSNTCKAASFLR